MSLPSTRLIWLLATVLAGACSATPPRVPQARPQDSANAHIIVAELALARGQHDVAVEEYRLATALSTDRALAGRAAEIALEGSEDDVAAEVTNRWLALDSLNPAAHRAAGLAALRLNRLPRAVELIESSLTRSGADGEKELLEVFATLANESNAYGVFVVGREMADKRPDSAQAQYAAAAFALPAYNYAYAAEKAERALALQPDFANAKRLLARSLVMSGNAQRGLELARASAADGDIEARLELAILNDFSGNKGEARKIYQALVESEAAHNDALYQLALLDFRERHYDEAAHRFTELLSLGRQVGAAFYYLGAIAERHGDHERAIRFYSRIISGEYAVDAQLRTARLLKEGGMGPQGEESLDAFVRDHPESEVELAIGRSRALSDQLQHRASLELVDRYLERYPHHMDLIMQRSLALDRAGRIADAVRVLRGLVRERPDDPVTLNALGYTLVDHNQNLNEGEALVRRALALMPDSPAVEDSMGWMHFRRARYADAVAILRKAYDQAQDPEIAAHLGEALWQLGERGKAREVWQEGLAIAPMDPYLNATLHRYGQ
jgi:tetratricopeptide (TPR) repeat protein